MGPDMTATLRFTILGCGSSGGVPRLGGIWGECDPDNPRNTRRRCSLLVERVTDTGTTTVLIDTSPDLRMQLLDAGIGHLDGVVYTHAHADHVHGIDDLRMVVFNMRERVRVWADGATTDALLSRFGYAFIQPEGSPYPPILDLHEIDGLVTVDGAGGPVTLTPFEVGHGAIDALGFRIGDLAYLPDVKIIPNASLPHLEGLKVWILDSLRRSEHPTHISFDEALAWFDRMKPERGILTNMHVDIDWTRAETETPDNVSAAFDGMQIELPG